MTVEKDCPPSFAEDPDNPLEPRPPGKFKKGTMSRPFEDALDAVEHMGEKDKH